MRAVVAFVQSGLWWEERYAYEPELRYPPHPRHDHWWSSNHWARAHWGSYMMQKVSFRDVDALGSYIHRKHISHQALTNECHQKMSLKSIYSSASHQVLPYCDDLWEVRHLINQFNCWCGCLWVLLIWAAFGVEVFIAMYLSSAAYQSSLSPPPPPGPPGALMQ
eukprot:scaffold355437_cov47-Prasinocladus_malaysianus.AAC.1